MDKSQEYMTIQKNAVNRYSERFEKLGVVPQALGWGEKKDQIERFQTLLKYNNFSGKSILDIGCGFADFYLFLKQQNISCYYTGIDIVPDFIKYCKSKFNDATFINANIMLEDSEIPNADYVISLGTLNFKLDNMDNLDYTKAFIEKAYQKANYKLICDFLSTNLTDNYPKEEQVYYHNPIDILNLTSKLTNDFELIHNYRAIPQKEYMLMLTKPNSR